MRKTTVTLLLLCSLYCGACSAMSSEDCLSLNIYHEARAESTEGWLAVAFVTLNRSLDYRFPDNICDVVYEPKQFSWTHDGLPDKPDLSKYHDRVVWKYIRQFAKGFLENHEYIIDPTDGSLYYHSTKVSPSWKDSFERSVVIGDHIFYVNNGRDR